MNFLNVFEQRVGSLFGATAQGLTAPFSFKKLAKKAAREMEAETYVINGVDTAPALYTILVSSEDDLAMRPLYAQITKETAQFIEGQAQGKGYAFVGRPVVRFMADPSLKSGKFSVFAENVDAQTLNRLREEEALFLGVGSSRGGLAADACRRQRRTGSHERTRLPAAGRRARGTSRRCRARRRGHAAVPRSLRRAAAGAPDRPRTAGRPRPGARRARHLPAHRQAVGTHLHRKRAAHRHRPRAHAGRRRAS